MSNLPEASSFDSAVYEIATTDPVIGGDETAISNKQAKALANRTRYLKDHVDALETAVTAIEAELAAPATTEAAGDDDTSLATTAFVHRNSGGFIFVDCGGAGNISLTSDEWGHDTIILVGARTANGNVIFPTRAGGDRWLVANRTTGLFAVTCKTAAGAGVKVAQGRSKDIWCDGTDILDAETDLSTRSKTVTGAYTFAPGDEVYIDQSGGAFATTAPLNPSEGDSFILRGNFLTSNHTVQRNGQMIRDKDGVPQATNYVADRNNVSAKWVFSAGAWQITQG